MDEITGLPPLPLQPQKSNKMIWVWIVVIAVVALAVAVFIAKLRPDTPATPSPEAMVTGTPFPPITPSPEESVVVCTEEYAPVCGIDNQTYSNRCAAEQQARVPVAHEGECA